MRYIDIQTWPRRQLFALYTTFDHPHLGMLRRRLGAGLALAALSLATGCSQGQEATLAPPTNTPPAISLPSTATAASPVCAPAAGQGTVLPVVSVDSITFVVNGSEHMVAAGDSLGARPGDQVAVTAVTLCVAPFDGNGGEACVDVAPVNRSGEEIVAAHQGSHLVALKPGLISIAWTSETWTVGEDWAQFAAVVNHWPASNTKDLDCAGGLCECDDRIIIALQNDE